jgi:hypothetical protein
MDFKCRRRHRQFDALISDSITNIGKEFIINYQLVDRIILNHACLPQKPRIHSHSIVPGGLLVTS